MFIVNACSQKDDDTNQSQQIEQKAFDELNSQIALLDVQYADQFLPETRRGGFWRRLGIFFACDAGGAAVGAKFGGIGAIVGGIWGSMMSLLISQKEYAVVLNDSIYDALNVEVINDKNALSDTADSVGYFHNVIISEILREKGDQIYSLSSSQLKSAIQSKVKKYYGPLPANLRILSSIYTQSEKVSTAFCDPDIQDPFAVLEKTMPGYKPEVKIIKTFCENLSRLPEDQQSVTAYTIEFKKVVKNSTISDISKNLIASGVSVAGNSNLLWSKAIQ